MREITNRADNGRDEKRNRRQLRPRVSEMRIQLRAQILQCGDIDLLDIGKMRRAPLGVLHLLRNEAPQTEHFPLANGDVRRAQRQPFAVFRFAEKAVQIALHDTAVRPAAGDIAQIDVSLLRTASHGG